MRTRAVSRELPIENAAQCVASGDLRRLPVRTLVRNRIYDRPIEERFQPKVPDNSSTQTGWHRAFAMVNPASVQRII